MSRSYEQYILPPQQFVLVSSGSVTADIELSENCRGLLVGSAGTLNVTMQNGTMANGLPFLQGVNPGFFKVIRSGGNAENTWAIY